MSFDMQYEIIQDNSTFHPVGVDFDNYYGERTDVNHEIKYRYRNGSVDQGKLELNEIREEIGFLYGQIELQVGFRVVDAVNTVQVMEADELKFFVKQIRDKTTNYYSAFSFNRELQLHRFLSAAKAIQVLSLSSTDRDQLNKLKVTIGIIESILHSAISNLENAQNSSRESKEDTEPLAA